MTNCHIWGFVNEPAGIRGESWGGDYDQVGQCHLQLPFYLYKGMLDSNNHKMYK